MTAAEFAAAMKHHGFGVCRARIVDTTGQCPGVSWPAVRRGRGSVDRNKALAKILRQRDAEIAMGARALNDPLVAPAGHEFKHDLTVDRLPRWFDGGAVRGALLLLPPQEFEE
jgi:hypothetical protein